MIRIFNSLGRQILDVEVDANSYRSRAIMGDHNLTLYFSLPTHTEIPVGAYVDYQGVRYTLDRPEALKMKHTRLFEYTVVFEAYQSCAKRWKFRNPVDGRLKFPLTATPREHLQMFVDNMNRRDTGWAIGSCISAVEHLISYDHAYCWEALQQMAEEFETEFEIVGKTVSLRKVEYNKSTPLPLSYGRGNGFKPNVGRSNSGDALPVEILFPQGGEQNIDPSTYGGRVLLLPKEQEIGYDGERFSDEDGFNSAAARWYQSSADGLSIQRKDRGLSSLAEDSLDCTEIYPKRVGKVGSVITVDADNHFYDFTDKNAESDPCPNYEDYLIEGETMTVIFQSGMLAGRELEVKYIHNAKTVKGVSKAARRFEIVPQEIDGITMPDATFKPAVDDTYIVLHCAMPQAYICDNSSKSGASWDMFRSAVKYLYENEEQKFTFTGELDGLWAKKDWVNIGGRIVLGGFVRFTDERFQAEPVLVRITAIKDYINNPHSPEITLSNQAVAAGFSSEIKRLQSEEVVVEENRRQGEQFTKRRFRDAKETMAMLEKSLIEGYSESISPVAAQMLQLLVGDESLQFRFVNSHSSDSPTIINPTFAYSSTTGIFSISGGYYMQHLTLGIDTIKASHAVSEYKWWTVQSYTSAVLDDPDKKYYVYLKCPTAGSTNCEYVLSETAIGMTDVSGYYHFLVGVLNSEYEGVRSFTQLYGFTEITGGRITTDKIVSGSGGTYWDLENNKLVLGNRLQFNVNGDGKLVLQGALVQTGNGTPTEIGSWCGQYDGTRVYGLGDEVWASVGGVVSTYRYINSTSGAGHAVTDDNYWIVVAAGVKGADGQDGKDGKDGKDGTDGQNGQDGNGINTVTIEYAYSSSGTQAPVTGWQSNVPSVPTGYYLWTRTTTTYTDGRTPTVAYSVSRKGADGADGEDGQDGQDGARGPALCYRGVYNKNPKTGATETIRYYGTPKRVDVVYYVDRYYVAKSTTSEGDAGFTGKIPTNTAYWDEFGASFDSVATGLLFAEEAVLENAIVRILKTNDSGARIIARGNGMSMFDTNNNLRLSITGENLGSTPSNVDYTVKYQTAIEHDADASDINSGELIAKKEQLALQLGSTNKAKFIVEDDVNSVLIPSMTLDVFLTVGTGQSTVGYMYWTGSVWLVVDDEIVASDEGDIDFEVSAGDGGSQHQNVGLLGRYLSLSAGEHTLSLQCRTIAQGHGFRTDNNVQFGMIVPTVTNGLKIIYPAQVTAIGANGFRAMFSGSQKAEFINENGTVVFLIRNGNYAIKLTNSGIQFSFNGGSTWYTGSRDSNGYLKLT